jgi:nucleoside-diphosphate-sugar epimerase
MPATVLITGANGFIGSHYRKPKELMGHKVVPVDVARRSGAKALRGAGGLRNIQRMMSTLNAKANCARIEEIVDNRIVRKLDENGFIDSLYSNN